MSVGVVIGRFQVPELSPGHKYLLEYVAARHDHLLVILGSSNSVPTNRNPLSFKIRSDMIIKYLSDTYSFFQTAEVNDSPSDQYWSNDIDDLISSQYPKQKAVLYGSRHSFIPYYSGNYLTEEIKTVESLSGTELREALKIEPVNSTDFRAGVIYGQLTKFPTSYQVVDVAVTKENFVLLGQKKTDPHNKWRFIGGFVDTTDQSLEAAAKREVMEETGGLETGPYEYIGSTRIDDWRYRDSTDKMMSAMFVTPYIFGKPIPSDDIDKLQWFNYTDISNLLVDTHKPLGILFDDWTARWAT